MKIENLVEKDTVLDDDYLIVDGTDGTKKTKKSTFLRDVNSSKANIANLKWKDINSGESLGAVFASQDIHSVCLALFYGGATDSPDPTASGVVLSFKDLDGWGSQMAIYNGNIKIRIYDGSNTPGDWKAIT